MQPGGMPLFALATMFTTVCSWPSLNIGGQVQKAVMYSLTTCIASNIRPIELAVTFASTERATVLVRTYPQTVNEWRWNSRSLAFPSWPFRRGFFPTHLEQGKRQYWERR